MNVTDTCITANLENLELRLTLARNRAALALELMREGKRNAAVGTLASLDNTLPEVQALFSTILLLHRAEPVSPSQAAMQGQGASHE